MRAINSITMEEPRESPVDQDKHWGALMAESQAGDKEAFQCLLTEISTVIERFCLKRAGYLGVTEDVVQETLIAIHRYRQSYDPDRSFRRWMFAIAKHKLVDAIRKRTKYDHADDFYEVFVTNPGALPYSTIGGQMSDHALYKAHNVEYGMEERKGQLTVALRQLPSKYREAFRLVKMEGFSVRGAAAELGVTESAVKVRVHRAFKMIVKKIGKGDEGGE